MKKFIWVIPIILLLLSACAPAPVISNVLADVSPGCECTVFYAEWETDVPTTAEVMICDEDVGSCQWFESDNCDYGHWFTAQLNPERHYKITLIASNCGRQSTHEIYVDSGRIR